MTLTIHLPQQVEQAYLTAAQAKGVSIDALVSDLLLSIAPVPKSSEEETRLAPETTEEFGITVLRSGHPIDPSVVNDTLELIRRERDMLALGLL